MSEFWRARRVFVTGHTGFKGSWLCLCLQSLGADVTGYALPPATHPSLHHAAGVAKLVRSQSGDVRDAAALTRGLRDATPEIVFHLAAQPLVRESYDDPVGTFATNAMGTVNLLQAVRSCDSVRVVVNVTSDKCYAPAGAGAAHREDSPLGGSDPYSASKGCAELIHAAYAACFFNRSGLPRIGLATARAGNVIGGGDWSADRIVPDAVRAFDAGSALIVRNPAATRPWQHVLDPLAGYLTLAERLWSDPDGFNGAWNFGPDPGAAASVSDLLTRLAAYWKTGATWRIKPAPERPETSHLELDSTKARERLGWQPAWSFDTAVSATAEWYQSFARGTDARGLCLAQIERHADSALGRDAGHDQKQYPQLLSGDKTMFSISDRQHS